MAKDVFDGLNDDIDESVDSIYHIDDKSVVGKVGFGSSEEEDESNNKNKPKKDLPKTQNDLNKKQKK